MPKENMPAPTKVRLDTYHSAWYDPGAGKVRRALWFLVNASVLQSSIQPFSGLRVAVLRLFGAKIGKGVVIKPGVNVKYPWRLIIGNHSWIGENAWLDSLEQITIGSNCCISQGACLCTGNHDWTDPAFGLIVKPIIVQDGAWVGATAVVLPGVTVGSHAIVTAGSVLTGNADAYQVYQGNPALPVKRRVIGKGGTGTSDQHDTEDGPAGGRVDK